MKIRTILGLLIVGLLLVAGSSSALADPNAPPTLTVVPGGWCDWTNLPFGGILLEAAGGVPSYTISFTPNPPPVGYTIMTGCTGGNCWLDVWAPVWSRITLDVTVTDSAGTPSNVVPVYVAVGHNGVNTIVGTDGPDMLFGLDGWDTLIGRGGNDLLCGGADFDTLKGDAGADTFSGGANGIHLDWCNGGPPSPLDPPPWDVQDGTCETAINIP